MAKLLTPLNQAALKAEDFSKIERENKEISVSYDRGFFHHVKKALGENKIAAVCLVVLCVIITAALMAPLSSVDPDYMDVMNKMAGPSKEHWFGTDELGRDSFTRALYGSRVSLLVGFATMVVSVTAGTCVGAISGYAGGKIDIILMRIVDMFQSVPSLLMIIVIFSFVPNNMVTLVLMLALWWRLSLPVQGVALALCAGALASALGYILWYALVPCYSIAAAAAAQLSVPVITALGAVVFVGEAITLRLVLCSAAILGGIFIVALWGQRHAVPRPDGNRCGQSADTAPRR